MGAYEVLSLLGAGGMGEVYRARDTRLGREVAIKVQAPGMALDAERLRRFETEARAASALNHPNILVVHDVGTHLGSPYLVSELLEGETLRTCLARGRLPAKKALEIGAQVASGLAAAHDRGIVHRDLKPENLFLTRDGHVKILDFGLAKQSPAATDQGRAGTLMTAEREAATAADVGTEPGKVLGTVSYMSPEQVRGEAVDHRSDIFSMGCVLYEMASGRRAFKRDTPPETMTAILREEPPDLAALSAELPPGFGRAIAHCLEKRSEERYQTARDLGFALKAAIEDSGESRSLRAVAWQPSRRRRVWASGAALVVVALALGAWWGLRGRTGTRGPRLEPKRVVVAFFENQTGDRSLDPIGRMAADWVSQGLSQIAGIEVVQTTDAIDAEQAIARAEAQGSRRDPLRALATATGAGVLVSGSYYVQGPTLQVQAKVMNASDWKLINTVEPISGERAAPMKVLDAMRQRVAGSVASHFNASAVGQGTKPPLYEAYREFAAAQELFGTDYTQAIRHFEKAAEIDPDFLAPQLLIAVARQNQGDFAGTEPILRRLSESRERATPRQRSFLDWLQARQAGRWAEALQAYRPIWEQEPSIVNDVTFAFTAIVANMPQLAVDTLKGYGAQEGDVDKTPPGFRPWPLGNLADAYHTLGRYERELEVADQALRLHPERLLGRRARFRALVALGRLEEARRVIDESLALQFPDGTAGVLLREASLELRAHGNRAAALQVAGREVEWVRGRPSAEQATEGYGRRLGDALYRAEKWDEARAVLQGLSLPRPLPLGRGVGSTDDMPEGLPALDVAGVLRTLGALAARRGERQEADRLAEELARLDGRFMRGAYTYWRAQIAALLGDKERAVALLREAFAQGYQFGYQIHRDMDLESLHAYPPYEELVRPKG